MLAGDRRSSLDTGVFDGFTEALSDFVCACSAPQSELVRTLESEEEDSTFEHTVSTQLQETNASKVKPPVIAPLRSAVSPRLDGKTLTATSRPASGRL